MRRIGEDLTPPTVSVESAMNKPVAQAGSSIRLLVMKGAEMITGHIEAAAVELADPALDRNFPVGVAVKKTADDADADRLPGRRRWRQRRRRKPASDHFADHLTVDLLQGAVVATLVGEQEGMSGANRLDQIALEYAAFHVIEQLTQLLFVGCTALRDFALVPIDNGQFGETGCKACICVARCERQRLSEIGGGFLIPADLQQTTAALVPGLGVVRIKLQRGGEIVDCIIGAIKREQYAAAIVPRLGEAGGQRKRAVVAGKSLGQPIDRLQHRAAIIQRFDIVGAQQKRTVETDQSFVVS